jgi:hypothetical protein
MIRIACDFERLDGYLFVPSGESGDLLEHELQAARRAGLAPHGTRQRFGDRSSHFTTDTLKTVWSIICFYAHGRAAAR